MLGRVAVRSGLTAVESGWVIRGERVESIKRLDRMASGAGFVYQRICFSRVDEAPGAVERVEVRPSVVYRRGGDGALREACDLYVELGGTVEAGRLRLELRDGRREQTVDLEVPAREVGNVRGPFAVSDGDGSGEG